MKEIIYIGHCVPRDNWGQRAFNAAANAVIWYISDVLHDSGFSVTVISACFGDVGKARGHYRCYHLADGYKLIMLPFLGYSYKLTRMISHVIFNFYRFLYLLFYVPKYSTVIVYHAVELIWIIKALKILKNIKLVIEVGEIYGDYWKNSRVEAKEYAYFKIADAFIFQSEKLESLVNVKRKPYIINYGNYSASNHTLLKLDDMIHCIYSGSFNPKKGGVECAIESAIYLPANYVLHICGRGSEEIERSIKSRINEINKTSKCKICFEGLLSKDKYEELLGQCSIGINTQNPNAPFNDTCFPSKILMYLCHGLNVVSSRIKVVEDSQVGPYLHYYNGDSPADLAKAIEAMKPDSQVKDIVLKLDDDFRKKIRQVVYQL